MSKQEEVKKILEKALEQDAKEAVEHGSGLPKDWRNRILKQE